MLISKGEERHAKVAVDHAISSSRLRGKQGTLDLGWGVAVAFISHTPIPTLD